MVVSNLSRVSVYCYRLRVLSQSELTDGQERRPFLNSGKKMFFCLFNDSIVYLFARELWFGELWVKSYI